MEWKNARENPPKESGVVVTMTVGISGKCISVQSMDYSVKHKAFNARDWEKKPKYKVEPDYWAEMPKPPKEG